MWGGRKSHWETYRIRQDSADHDCSLVFFAVIFQKHWCLCRHTVVHLGISGYLHKCIAEARWEMERLIDFTWVHSEKGANLRIRNLGKQSLESCGKQPYWVTFVFLSATEGESGLRGDRIDGEKRLHMRHVQKVRLTRHANAHNGFPAGEREVGLPKETRYYCF